MWVRCHQAGSRSSSVQSSVKNSCNFHIAGSELKSLGWTFFPVSVDSCRFLQLHHQPVFAAGQESTLLLFVLNFQKCWNVNVSGRAPCNYTDLKTCLNPGGRASQIQSCEGSAVWGRGVPLWNTLWSHSSVDAHVSPLDECSPLSRCGFRTRSDSATMLHHDDDDAPELESSGFYVPPGALLRGRDWERLAEVQLL